ncbi:hypothetical protein [Paenibacillus macquariensis]|uniref:Integrase n=1 Tax=Paenibacillus macquariensis TaxID=948756 RepID=A0ABY1JW36_9BACL|nr:hypothetical protein [Paenibacillus macquariensis]MEC0093470.1 hypothetical protein [Paenibacillus macquariensis]OAB34396.1 hypothetical protein PMSM_10990 [Paenibacillus macquariensis subsp. macquariensis]SIQ87453.1 hypothetical protein SAMN05421578_104437 [Paenibacillus macquariensis]
MELKQVINSSGTLKTILIEDVVFQSHEVSKYKDIFESLKVLGIIERGEFSDRHWYSFDEIKNVIVPLRFELDVYAELQLSLKCFIASQLAMSKSSSTVKITLESLKTIMLETNGFKIDKLNSFLSELEVTSPKQAYRYSRYMINYLNFYPIKNREKFLERCYTISRIESKNRDLPELNDIIEFDRIVNDYFRRSPIEDHLMFKPIQIFWVVTNIIPLRPSEFALLKANCLVPRNGKYYIKVPRIKNREGDTITYPEIQITEDIYFFIQEFILRQEQMGIESPYLCSLEFHELFYEPNWRRKNTDGSESFQDRVTSTQLHNLLKRFYKQVVEGMYNEHTSMQIIPAHTRHFAIINMFLQGYNMLSIARMAGHLDLKTQDNYYSHARTFAQSHVYNLLRTSMGEKIGENIPNGIFGWRQKLRDKSARFIRYSHDELSEKYRKVKYGYCESENFPYDCVEDCRVCLSHFIFKPRLDEERQAGTWLESYSKELQQKIETTLDLMITTSKSLSKLSNPLTEASFSNASRQLQKYMDHKLLIDLKISEGDYNGGEV